MNAQDIRKAYLDFFKQRGHAIIPRASLLLDGDPTTLFTGSGMQPMIPYLLGEPHPLGNRIADSQTCLRAQDIDEIGDNRHTTFFEMLGNWSLGDYFKKDQIQWMWQFLTEVVELDPEKLYVTCYIGEPEYDIPKDEEAAKIWQELFESKGIEAKAVDIGSEDDGYGRGVKPGERVFFYDGSKNWWSRGGSPENTPIGDPCGPDSEMFYDFGIEHDKAYGEHCHPNCDCGRFMEIGNNVFMAYKKVAEGKFELLDAPNVDHGSGLERIAAAKLNDPDVFKISLMRPIVEKLEELSGRKYEDNQEAMRVIADHLRAATFLAVDGCVPSNKEQGYVMRRLIRRAIRFANELGIDEEFFEKIIPVITDLYIEDFPEVAQQRDKIIITMMKEEKAFMRTVMRGLRHLRRFVSNGLTGKEIFILHDTYGFPWELSVEIARRENIKLDDNWKDVFDKEMEEQRRRSQTAAKGTFKGGLEGHDPIHIKYHTATHLLQSALREIFGKELRQHGSNITTERLRFDFNLDRKMTSDEIKRAEDLVNGWIDDDLPVKYTMYPTEEALEMGAIGPFGERYGESVKVYQMGPDGSVASLEICGGPHVERTGTLSEEGKKFKITKEEASSAGIRRIKAVLV